MNGVCRPTAIVLDGTVGMVSEAGKQKHAIIFVDGHERHRIRHYRNLYTCH